MKIATLTLEEVQKIKRGLNRKKMEVNLDVKELFDIIVGEKGQGRKERSKRNESDEEQEEREKKEEILKIA